MFLPEILPSHKENSEPGSSDISAGSPVHKRMASGLVRALYTSSGVAGMIKYFLKSLMTVDSGSEDKRFLPNHFQPAKYNTSNWATSIRMMVTSGYTVA